MKIVAETTGIIFSRLSGRKAGTPCQGHQEKYLEGKKSDMSDIDLPTLRDLCPVARE